MECQRGKRLVQRAQLARGESEFETALFSLYHDVHLHGVGGYHIEAAVWNFLGTH